MELYSMLCGSLDGRTIWGRMDTCICMTESLHYPPEIITTLLISYTLIQNKKLKKNVGSCSVTANHQPSTIIPLYFSFMDKKYFKKKKQKKIIWSDQVLLTSKTDLNSSTLHPQNYASF